MRDHAAIFLCMCYQRRHPDAPVWADNGETDDGSGYTKDHDERSKHDKKE